MQMIDCVIEQDPSLAARRTIDMRRYIVNRWSRTHEDPIDEDAVALFLCDESRGNLTDEQRIFAKECREEIEACYRNAVFQMFQCGEMMCRHLVSGPEEYCRIFLPQYAVPCSKRLSPCNGLCGAVCPLWGQGRAPAPLGAFRADLARFWAVLRDRAKWGPRRSPAERVRWGEAEQRNERVFAPMGRKRGMWSLRRRQAGESPGAFMVPGRSLPPAVRAVSGVEVGAVSTNPI